MKRIGKGLLAILLLASLSLGLTGCLETASNAVILAGAVNGIGASAERRSDGYNGKYPWFKEEPTAGSSRPDSSTRSSGKSGTTVPAPDSDPFGQE